MNTTPLPTPPSQIGHPAVGVPQAPPLQLEDIHLPDPISFWPLAPGWWLLLLGLIAIACSVLWFFHTQRRADSWLAQRRVRRAVHISIEDAYTHWQSHQDNARYCTDLNHVLKRYCRYRYTREHSVLSLSGHHWVDFLESSSSVRFTSGQRQALAEGLYQKPDEQNRILDSEHQAESLKAICLQWLATNTPISHNRADNPVTGDQ